MYVYSAGKPKGKITEAAVPLHKCNKQRHTNEGVDADADTGADTGADTDTDADAGTPALEALVLDDW